MVLTNKRTIIIAAKADVGISYFFYYYYFSVGIKTVEQHRQPAKRYNITEIKNIINRVTNLCWMVSKRWPVAYIREITSLQYKKKKYQREINRKKKFAYAKIEFFFSFLNKLVSSLKLRAHRQTKRLIKSRYAHNILFQGEHEYRIPSHYI